MIGYLQGVVKVKNINSIVLLTSTGVGYKVYVPPKILEKAKQDSQCSLFIHTHVREDQISLFGFVTEQDLEVFEMLITVSGVGPKTAMNIFNAGSGEQISDAIFQKNKLFFKGVSGLGSKTTEKIFVELQGKVGATSTMDYEHITTNLEEAASALQNLGYHSREIFEFFRKNPGMEGIPVEEVIKKFLKK